MNLFEILKQFKNIEPDPGFSEISKRAILAATPVGIATRATAAWTAKRSLLRILEAGVAVALTGLFILIIAGGLTGSKLAPVEYSAIDPRGIRAEAQAIDIQIQLANVTYRGSSAESTVPIAGVKPAASAKPSAPSATSSQGTGGGEKATSATATSTLTIDQALEGLSN